MYRGSPIAGFNPDFQKKEFITVLIGALGGAAAKQWATTYFRSELIGAFIGAVVATSISSAMADDSETLPLASGVLLNKASNNAPLNIVYGRRRIGGTRVLMEVTGDKNEKLHIVLALCEGEIEEVERVYFNGVWIHDPQFDDKVYYPDLGEAAGGTVNSVVAHLGADAQTADSDLVAAVTDWTTDHRLRGTAYLYVYLEFDRDIFPTGMPVVAADVMGVKVYDSRTSTTAWSDNPALCIRDYLTNSRYGRDIDSSLVDDTSFEAAADYCDEIIDHPSADQTNTFSTIELVNYPSPPTLSSWTTIEQMDKAVWDTLVEGTKFTMSGWVNGANNGTFYISHRSYHSDNGYFVAISNDGGNDWVAGVDEVATVDIDFSALKLKRYTCNGVVDTTKGSMDILRDLLTSCRGFLIFSGGKYKLILDKVETVDGNTFTFNEDNITGAWSIKLGDKNTRFNRVRGNFFNSARRWQADIAPVESSTYRTEDNELLLEQTIELPFTSDLYRAQELATVHMHQSRQQTAVEFTATIEGLRCEVGDVVYIKHSTTGWDTGIYPDGKLFRVMRLALKSNDEVRVSAIEYNESSYDFTLTEADAIPDTSLPNPWLHAVGTVSDVIINAQDYIYNGQIDITWSSSAISFRDHILLTVDGVAGSEEVTRNSVTSTTPNTLSDPNVSIQKMMPVVGPVGFPAYDLILTLSAAERAKLGVNQVITMSGWSGTNATVFSDVLWHVYNITDNSDSTTTLRIFAVEYRERFTSFPTSSALTIYTENTGLAKSNPAAYYYREYSIQDLDSYALDNLPHGTYEITLTPVNTLGVNGTPYTVGVTIDPPPVPDVKGVELDLGGDGQGNETEWTGKDCKIKWRAGTLSFSYSVLNGEDPNGAGYGAIDAYIKDFMVEVYNGTTLLRTEYVTDTWYTYTYEKNAEDAVKQSATPYRDLNFKIWARGRQNQISENVAVL